MTAGDSEPEKKYVAGTLVGFHCPPPHLVERFGIWDFLGRGKANPTMASVNQSRSRFAQFLLAHLSRAKGQGSGLRLLIVALSLLVPRCCGVLSSV